MFNTSVKQMIVHRHWFVKYILPKTLDRIDCDGHYEPSNCRWVDPKDQQRNKRNSVVMSFNGHSKTAAEWAELTGLGGAIYTRLYRGWTVDRILSTPLLRGPSFPHT